MRRGTGAALVRGGERLSEGISRRRGEKKMEEKVAGSAACTGTLNSKNQKWRRSGAALAAFEVGVGRG